MRILYVGNGQGFEGALKYYFIPQKLINGFIRLGHSVVSINDRDVARYSNIFRSQKRGVEKMNVFLLEQFRVYRPDFVVLGHCKNVRNEILHAMRDINPDVRIAYRNVDPLHSGNNVRDILQRVGVVDTIFITTAGESLAQFSHPNTKVSFMPNPVDPALETQRSYQNSNADIDFLFLASFLRDQKDHRAVTARYLVDHQPGMRLHIGGAGVNENLVYGAAFYDLLGRSKMGLCMNKTQDYYLYASDRMSQYMGSGLLTFIPEGPKFEDILGDDCFVSFSTNEELLEKIHYFLSHEDERIQMARCGCERVHDYFHSDKVAQYMIDCSFEQNLSMDYKWPTTQY
ncbi:MAG TPA: glycosyltransferase [Alphaproteobacteria bacterium]|nr:glycosyltransferase family 1 protein [Alphaproteobacteria bacterium]HOO50592.1 glycosyltransferase [Alphaproteobacteria bacterium]